jgi:uncharacterized cupin superfamily protein
MTETPKPHPLVRVADRAAEESFSHPLNPESRVSGVGLSDAAGMERVGLSFIRVPPGREANIHHAHHCEEEFYYVLSGRGVIEIGDEEYEIGPGDFAGFPTPAVGHLIKNTSDDEDLVYLAGGERKRVEVAVFPKIGKHLIRTGREGYLVDSDRLEPAWKRY